MSVVPAGHWMTPPEVGEIASEFRAAADQIRSVYGSVNAVGGQLDQSWRGNAKNIFDAHFNAFPKEILAYANDLDHMASEILNIQVWVYDET
jgi:WXG100 family type VII secretion target